MNDILFEILKAVTVLMIVLLTRYAIPWIRMQAESTKYARVIQCAELTVRSVEQTIIGNKTGLEKKAIVTKFLKEQLLPKLGDRRYTVAVDGIFGNKTLEAVKANIQQVYKKTCKYRKFAVFF